MKKFCTIPPDINTCPYYISPHNASESSCSNPDDSCGMLQREKDKEPYKRSERWYEKYYKK